MNIQDIFEALTFSQARPYMKAQRTDIYDGIFKRFEKYADRRGQRLIFPLMKTSRKFREEDFAIAKSVTEHLLRNSIVNFLKETPTYYKFLENLVTEDSERFYQDYLDGVVRVKGERRKFKIGKLFQQIISSYDEILAAIKVKDFSKLDISGTRKSYIAYLKEKFKETKEAYAAYQNDPIRRDINQDPIAYSVIISRHPYDIAGASTGRGWTSCIDMRVFGKFYLPSFKDYLVAYLVNSNDIDIKNPISRIMIIRYDRIEADGQRGTDFILQADSRVYGASSALFQKTVDRFCRSINKGKDDGAYCNMKSPVENETTMQKTANTVKKIDQPSRKTTS
jgi:hypothetical protein